MWKGKKAALPLPSTFPQNSQKVEGSGREREWQKTPFFESLPQPLPLENSKKWKGWKGKCPKMAVGGCAYCVLA